MTVYRVAGISTAVAAVALVFVTLLSFLGTFHWLLDLASHFRGQLAIGSAAMADETRARDRAKTRIMG